MTDDSTKLAMGLSSLGVLIGLAYGVSNKSGVLKTIGWMFVGSLAGYTGASAYTNLKK
ncbi:MAG: hypothetical protein ACOVOQ_14900 [Flavobacterium sp.]|jgi:hypothetical protein